jgi:hypothetical protein
MFELLTPWLLSVGEVQQRWKSHFLLNLGYLGLKGKMQIWLCC